ncbi:S49 family peptidase domain-containing protein [Roseibium alexandrii]|uniref:ClpP protease-like protein n=1 Tax=Roseibium alexandrii (strain DSM 17067 / NCIMB 14079 / DFL-11) TaxID=244592 RepID=A0A5E8GZH6_ROSAD|nr:hypothetical protein [Roseibium alexandrii]EEE45004.2 hypothetical protein SADFL11_2292 [Roseibium alexandrii DFL-11]
MWKESRTGIESNTPTTYHAVISGIRMGEWSLFGFGLMMASLVFFLMPGRANAVEIERFANHLVLSGEIADYSPGALNRNLVEALLDLAMAGDRTSPVYLHLNLPKGCDAAASFRLVDIIRSAQDQGTRVVAQVSAGDTCMSGCTFLFLAADERWMAPEGRLVFHGFTRRNAARPGPVPERYIETYYKLLAAANQTFFEFFKATRIIEDDRKVGFTGQTLFEERAFAGLVTRLLMH